MYIGSSVGIRQRISRHRATLRGKYHVNRYLQSAWDKYGESSFEFRKILVCTPNDRLFYEQLLIDKYQVADKQNGFNLSTKASYPEHSPEIRKIISDKLRGRSSWNKGRSMSPRTKEKLKNSIADFHKDNPGVFLNRKKRIEPIWNKGLPMSEETKMKISAALKGKVPHNKGKFSSRDTKRKISEAKKIQWSAIGNNLAREKMRSAKLGKKQGPYTTGNVLKTHCPKGHPYSGDNLYKHPNANRRGCRTCIKISAMKQVGAP